MDLIFVSLISFVISFAMIKLFSKYSIFQPVREEILAIRKKELIPTMGGLAIFCAANIFFIKNIPLMLVANAYAILGLIDDVLKIKQQHYKGINIKIRVFFEIAIGLLFAWYIISIDSTRNYIPILGNLGILNMIWGSFIIIATANAYNLSDGIDSLAATLGIFLLTFVALKSGTQMPLVFVFAILGFLFFNLPPARIYMGDIGALGIGASIGAFFYQNHLEMALPFVGIILVAQTITTIIQIFYIRKLKRKFFLMCPLHHHLELKGWKKGKILFVFNTITAICFLIGLGVCK